MVKPVTPEGVIVHSRDMDVELREIVDFLVGCPPFDRLGSEDVSALVPALTQRYHRRGEVIVAPGQVNDVLHVVRSGAVEICDPEGSLLDIRDVGDCFGYSTLAASGPSRYLMKAAADTLVLILPREVFEDIAARDAEFLRFFGERTDRIRDDLVATRLEAAGGDVLGTTVAELLTRDPVTVAPDRDIRAAAELMTSARVSSLLVVDGGAVTGILTDRDLRSRVLAAGVDPARPVWEVMTADPVTVDGSARAFDATVVMMDRGVRHLPVVQDGRPIGVLSATGLFRLTQADPVYLAARIDRAVDRAAVAQHMAGLPAMVAEMARRGSTSADDIGRVVTAAADAANRRLVELAIARLGPPPVSFCWIVAGSQARGELGVASDQDSALVLAERPDEAGRRWFDALTAEVRDGLAEAGFPVCPGDMMAANPRWRMTVAEWAEQAATWVQSPQAENVLDAQVFFDMRAVAGDVELAEKVRRVVLEAAAGSSRFQAHLARSAADWQPPLGFFRGLVVEKRGAYRNTLDVKAGGLAPVVQIARLHALTAGLPEVGTVDRLLAAVRAGALVDKDAANLVEAFRFLRLLQLRHHAECIDAGREPDNHLDPSALSNRDRHRLRAAFRVISEQQQALAMRYPIRQM